MTRISTHRAIVPLCTLLAACGPGDKDSATDDSSDASSSAPTTSASTDPATDSASGSGSDESTAGPAIDCSVMPQFFPEFDKSCAVAQDCIIVLHTDCCGPLAIGLNKSEADAFTAAETQCAMQCPPVGCDHATIAEDGNTAPNSMDVQVDCIAMQCKTFVL